MKELRQHLQNVVSDGLKPNFTARVVQTARADRRVASVPVWRPIFSLLAALAVCVGATALHAAWYRPSGVELDASWINVIIASQNVRFHL
jgi:hypothetical protein